MIRRPDTPPPGAPSMILCPRCETNHYTPYGATMIPGAPLPPALSRIDNETYICSECGQAEALRDFAGAPPIPPNEWPIR